MSLQLVNISKSYQNGKQQQTVLKNISITFPIKGMVGIIGSSGKGKSTLLNIIAGIETQDSGTVKMNMMDLDRTNYQDKTRFRKEYISFMYQYYNMIDALTMKENILLASGSKQNITTTTKEELLQLAKELKVEHLLERYPKQLSGGQLQRMALIRTILCHTPIVLADEPTGALNQENGRIIMEALQKYAKKHLVIVVSHDTTLLQTYVDDIIDLDSEKTEYHFATNRYDCFTPIASLYHNTKIKWLYVIRQLLHNKNKLLLIITSQIFTVITFVMLVSGYFGVVDHLDTMYQSDPFKKYVEVQKNDYTKPTIKEEEYALLKNEMVASMQYDTKLSNGTTKYQEKECHTEYSLLPKDRGHIQLDKGILPTKQNEICINQGLADVSKININDTLEYTFNDQKYTFVVSGIIEDKMHTSAMVYVDTSLLQQPLKEEVITKERVVVEVKETKDVEKYLKALDNVLFYSYSSHLDTVDSYQSLIELGTFVALIFIVTSFGISLLLIMIILSTMMYERRKDSAMLLVFGMSRSEVLLLFLKENGCIALLVSILGCLLSRVVIYFCNTFHLFSFLTSIDPLFKIQGSKIDLLIFSIYLFSCAMLTVFSSTKIFKMNSSQLLKEE